MRNLLIAGLMLSPMLITSAAVASSPKTDATVATQNLKVTTGVSTPEIIDPSSIRIPAADVSRMVPSEAQVVLSLNVDQNGKASNVQVVRSISPEVDGRIVSAIRLAHFRPATLDHQPVAVDMNLVVTVRR
jgi:TonB family protein